MGESADLARGEPECIRDDAGPLTTDHIEPFRRELDREGQVALAEAWVGEAGCAHRSGCEVACLGAWTGLMSES
jgi:hypothetical protein